MKAIHPTLTFPRRATFALILLLFGNFIGSCGNHSGSGQEIADNTPVQPVGPGDPDGIFDSQQATAKFLTQATFGPSSTNIHALNGSSASQWFKGQLSEPANFVLPMLREIDENYEEIAADQLRIEGATFAFWKNSISGSDQLRQRVAFALSELLVVSNGGGELLTDRPEAVSYYQDILITHAFGNYRDLLEAVTYSPAMGHYLTYMGSQKEDPLTGRMPDENYARELLQLFTIGVLELNEDGTLKLDSHGEAIETYNNADITGLAKVFTGLNVTEQGDLEEIDANEFTQAMVVYPEDHSDSEKTFLGVTIPAGTDASTSIDLALNHIFAHPNLGPFIGTQLIQRLVTSNPSPAYVSRVTSAFNQGYFELPDGSGVGKERRGDLTATIAAILFDSEALILDSSDEALANRGKVREPILRFTHWARAFNVENVTPEQTDILWDVSGAAALAQHPYRPNSVFNFFRPGYVAPGTNSGAKGLKAPELQITNASSIPGYGNFMSYFIFNIAEEIDVEELQQEYDLEELPLNARLTQQSFIANYDAEIALANNIDSLLNHLDLLLTYETLSLETRNHIKATLEQIEIDDEYGLLYRVQIAIFMIMTSPDYLVQS